MHPMLDTTRHFGGSISGFGGGFVVDTGSIIALAIVLALFAAVVVGLVRKSRRGGGCVDCADEGCAFHGTSHEPIPGETLADGTQAHCPSMQRALADVDARLGALSADDGDTARPGKPAGR